MTYALEVVNLAIFKHLNGMKTSQIALELQITVNTLKNWFRIYETNISKRTAITVDEYERNTKKRTCKSAKYESKVKDFSDKNIGFSLKTLSNHINRELSFSSLSRMLKKLNITRKRIRTHVYPKDIVHIEQARKEYAKKTDLTTFMDYK